MNVTDNEALIEAVGEDFLWNVVSAYVEADIPHIKEALMPIGYLDPDDIEKLSKAEVHQSDEFTVNGFTEKDGTLTEQEIRSKITDRTKIVSIAHVSNVLGVTNPVRKIADTAHAHGAVVVVDGAQSTPHIPVNVNELGADFYAFSGHKLCAPMGIGVLYGRKELLEDMPPFLTGGEMIEYVERQTATFADVPEKFEAGTVNAMGAVGLGAAIHYLQGVGFDTIRKTEEELTARLMDGLSRIPEITVYGSSDPAKHCGIVTFNIEGCHPHDVASVLDTEHIAVRAGHHCAQPLMKWLQVNATTRASLYFYNTEEEVDRFVAAAGKVRGWLGY